MKPLRLAIYILFFYVEGKSENPFTWEEVKATSKGAIISQDFINPGQQPSV
jgi:hypothetical protein